MSEQQQWGIYDTKDDVWLGNDDGPFHYVNCGLARAVAQIAEEAVFNTDLTGRFKAKELPIGSWRLRDKLALKHSPLKAIQRIEMKVE